MEFEKLFQVLVVGGSVLATGCATKTNVTPPEGLVPVASESRDTPSEDTQADPNAAAATLEPVGTAPNAAQVVAKSEVDCEKVCDFSAGEGREALCPDETMDGAENCCWLMSVRHECCP